MNGLLLTHKFLWYMFIQNFKTVKRESIYAISFKTITLSFYFCIQVFHKLPIIKVFVTSVSNDA